MEKIVYSCETKDGSRKKIKATPSTLMDVIRQRFKIEPQKDIILQTHDAVRDRWYDVEEEDLEDLVGDEDIMVVIRGNREEVLTSSFTDLAEMPTLTHASTTKPSAVTNHQQPIQFAIGSPAPHASGPTISSEPSSSKAPSMASLKREELDAMFGDTEDLEYEDNMVVSDSEDCNTFTADNVIDGLSAKKRKRDFSASDDESGSTIVASEPATSVASLTILNASNVQRPCWPTNFIIRDEFLDITVKRKLASKQTLNKNERKKLFVVVYEECVKHEGGYAPNTNMYGQMTTALLAKYPYLRGEAGSLATTTWKTRLNNHFRNTRKRGDREVPEVQQKINQVFW